MNSWSFNTGKLLISYISPSLYGPAILLFLIQQILLGESLIIATIYSFTLAIVAANFNLLKGLSSLNGLLFTLYAASAILAHTLICIFLNLKITIESDPQNELIILNLVGFCTFFVATLIYRAWRGNQDSETSWVAMFGLTNHLSLSIFSVSALLVMTYVSYYSWLPNELQRFTQISYACLIIGATRLSNIQGKGFLGLFFIISGLAITWKAHGLSGMKSSLMSPVVCIIFAAALARLRVGIYTLLLTIATLIIVAVVAFAIQPLRNLEQSTSKDSRLEYAGALLTADLYHRYDLQLSNLSAQQKSMLKNAQSSHIKESKTAKAGMLNRISLYKSNAAMVSAIHERGAIPFNLYLSELLILPRIISGDNFQRDKMSAFYGRYAGEIGKKNRSTGVAFSSHIISYAHGGYLMLILNLLVSVIVLFMLQDKIFGINPLSKNIGQAWFILLVWSLGFSPDVLTIWHLISRKLPIFVISYALALIISRILANKASSSHQITTQKTVIPYQPKQSAR
jgi:hypothetical protein